MSRHNRATLGVRPSYFTALARLRRMGATASFVGIGAIAIVYGVGLSTAPARESQQAAVTRGAVARPSGVSSAEVMADVYVSSALNGKVPWFYDRSGMSVGAEVEYGIGMEAKELRVLAKSRRYASGGRVSLDLGNADSGLWCRVRAESWKDRVGPGENHLTRLEVRAATVFVSDAGLMAGQDGVLVFNCIVSDGRNTWPVSGCVSTRRD